MDKVDMMSAQSFRWENYVLFNQDTIDELWQKHLSTGQRRVLYILGNGFDLRMNNGLESLIKSCPGIQVTCLLIKYDSSDLTGVSSDSTSETVNLSYLETLIEPDRLIIQSISLTKWATELVYVGDSNAINLIIKTYSDINIYTDIFLDISSLPRGIYISLAGKILSLIDENINHLQIINFFILATENAKMDALIQEGGFIGRPKFLKGFSVGSNAAYDNVKPMLWLPMLGENKKASMEASYQELTQTSKPEIYPVLPFPSRDPRRSDNLFQHHRLLFEQLTIDPKDVLYVPERNPYEVYLGLARTIVRFNRSMNLLGGCRTTISPFSSKLLSIGAMLISYELNKFRKENKIEVGILTTLSDSYQISDPNLFNEYHHESEIFVTWIAGEPYALSKSESTKTL